MSSMRELKEMALFGSLFCPQCLGHRLDRRLSLIRGTYYLSKGTGNILIVYVSAQQL